jgi:hypothetical protein
LQVDNRWCLYVTMIPRRDGKGERQYSDVPGPVVPHEHIHLTSVWVLDDCVYSLAPPGVPIAPWGSYQFSLHDHTLFEPGRRFGALARQGGRDESGAVVNRTPADEARITEKIREAMAKGQFVGHSRIVFQDAEVYYLAADPQISKLSTKAVAFAPKTHDSGGVALLGLPRRRMFDPKEGGVFFFPYEFENDQFQLKSTDWKLVGQVPLSAERIFLSPRKRIFVTTDQGVMAFLPDGEKWRQIMLAEPFKVIGRVWDRTTDEDLLLGEKPDQCLLLGSLSGDGTAQPQKVNPKRAQELHDLWTRRPEGPMGP